MHRKHLPMYRELEVLAVAVTLFVGCRDQAEPSRLAADAPSDQRHIALEGQSNFRDLGGYLTADGRTVKWAQVYRSGELPRLTDKDVAKLKELGVKTVVNFLTEAEIEAHGEDRLPDGVEVISLPISGGADGGLAKVILEGRQRADFSKVPVELNPEIHRLLIRDAKKQYATLLRQLADPEKRPLVFHCSHGVHRTGTAVAIVLSALGVPWKTVRKDYLLSNECRKEEVARRLGQLRERAAKNRGITPQQVDMTNMRAFYILQPSCIDASLKEAVKRHGSMEKYIRDGLGIKNEDLEKLRNVLLDK